MSSTYYSLRINIPFSGILDVSIDPKLGQRIVLLVDPSIALYYRSTIPKFFHAHPTRYEPHISVVRKEIVSSDSWNLALKLHGKNISFAYDPFVFDDGVYFWLNVESEELVSFRKYLGLTAYSEMARPPDGSDCFHMTIANTK